MTEYDTVHISGLPLGITDDQLRSVFGQYAPVLASKLGQAAPGESTVAGLLGIAKDASQWLITNLNGKVPTGLQGPVGIQMYQDQTFLQKIQAQQVNAQAAQANAQANAQAQGQTGAQAALGNAQAQQQQAQQQQQAYMQQQQAQGQGQMMPPAQGPFPQQSQPMSGPFPQQGGGPSGPFPQQGGGNPGAMMPYGAGGGNPGAMPPPQMMDPVIKDKLYVKGLPGGVTEDMLKQIFGAYGTVKSTRVLPQTAGMPDCAGFVRFSSQQEAQNVIDTCNGQVIQGSDKPLVIRFAGERAPPEERQQARQRQNGGGGGMQQEKPPDPIADLPKVNLYITGLPMAATKDSVHMLFSQYGMVQSTKVLPVPSGKTAAAGFVIMEEEAGKWCVENLSDSTPEGFDVPIKVQVAGEKKDREAAKAKGKGGKSEEEVIKSSFEEGYRAAMAKGKGKAWGKDDSPGYVAPNFAFKNSSVKIPGSDSPEGGDAEAAMAAMAVDGAAMAVDADGSGWGGDGSDGSGWGGDGGDDSGWGGDGKGGGGGKGWGGGGQSWGGGGKGWDSSSLWGGYSSGGKGWGGGGKDWGSGGKGWGGDSSSWGGWSDGSGGKGKKGGPY